MHYCKVVECVAAILRYIETVGLRHAVVFKVCQIFCENRIHVDICLYLDSFHIR